MADRAATLAAKLDSVLQQIGSSYPERSRLQSDVKTLFRSCNTLQPHHGTFTGGGRTVTLFYLHGVVPITYKGNVYNIPVTIYFDPPYPRTAPRCFVSPTANMAVKPEHQSVDQGGMIYLPYLSNWDRNASNLPDLVATMASVFSLNPPVHSTTAAPRPVTQMAAQSMQQFGTATTAGYPARAQAVPVVAATPIPQADRAPTRHTQMARKLEVQAKETWEKDLKPIVDDTNQQLSRLKKLKDESIKADAEITRLASAIEAHKGREAELAIMEQSLTKFVEENRSKEPDPDEFAANLDGDSEQVLNLLGEELACEDFLVALDELLTAGKITIDDFLRETRNVSRDQFMLKAKRSKAAAAVAQAAGVPPTASFTASFPAPARPAAPARVAALA